MKMNTIKSEMYEEILIEDFLDIHPKCEVLASTDNCLLAINRILNYDSII